MYVVKGIDYYLFNHGSINYRSNTFLVTVNYKNCLILMYGE